MRNRLFLSIFFTLLFLIPGCIEIAEDITINADGSGTIKVSVDAGVIGGSISSDNSKFDVSILEKIRKIPADAPQLLTNVEGIKNVQGVSNEKKGYYSVSFDFTCSRALNKAIYALAGARKSSGLPNFIKITRHKLIKKDISPYLRKAMGDKQKKGFNEMLYSFISYKSTCHFPADVKKAKNIKSARPDARTVVTRFTLDEMLKGGFDFGNVIKF